MIISSGSLDDMESGREKEIYSKEEKTPFYRKLIPTGNNENEGFKKVLYSAVGGVALLGLFGVIYFSGGNHGYERRLDKLQEQVQKLQKTVGDNSISHEKQFESLERKLRIVNGTVSDLRENDNNLKGNYEDLVEQLGKIKNGLSSHIDESEGNVSSKKDDNDSNSSRRSSRKLTANIKENKTQNSSEKNSAPNPTPLDDEQYTIKVYDRVYRIEGNKDLEKKFKDLIKDDRQKGNSFDTRNNFYNFLYKMGGNLDIKNNRNNIEYCEGDECIEFQSR